MKAAEMRKAEKWGQKNFDRHFSASIFPPLIKCLDISACNL
jgi:hypothetical protein